MIILDTNVASALMSSDADLVVRRWADRYPISALWLTAVTVFEVRFGIELLPNGRKRQSLEKDFARAIADDFHDRICELDESAAKTAAAIAARRRLLGRTSDLRDMLIAGIVLSRNAELATRNIRHFENLGVRIIDPWAG